MNIRALGYETVFKALADRDRLRVVNLLLGAESLCGCEFMGALEIAQYEVSRHLAVLRRAGLVTARKQGRWVYYSLIGKPDGLRDLWGLLRAAFRGDSAMARDAERLKARLALREGGSCVVGGIPRGRLGRRREPGTMAAREK